MNDTQLWNCEHPVIAFEIEVPDWIEQSITVNTLKAIEQGGCESGAYMPAVTYHAAAETMGEHGDAVLTYIEEYSDEIPAPPKGSSWSGIAVFYLSHAVELWARVALSELEDKLPIPHAELSSAVEVLIKGIGEDYRVEAGDGPAMEVTFATDDTCSQWTYQTGNNSFHGNAYGLPHWAVVTLTPDSEPDEIADEILSQWEDLIG